MFTSSNLEILIQTLNLKHIITISQVLIISTTLWVG